MLIVTPYRSKKFTPLGIKFAWLSELLQESNSYSFLLTVWTYGRKSFGRLVVGGSSSGGRVAGSGRFTEVAGDDPLGIAISPESVPQVHVLAPLSSSPQTVSALLPRHLTVPDFTLGW